MLFIPVLQIMLSKTTMFLTVVVVAWVVAAVDDEAAYTWRVSVGISATTTLCFVTLSRLQAGALGL